MESENWDVKLIKKYPNLFSNIEDEKKSCLSLFGIECSSGWEDILKNICFEIEQHEKNIANRPNGENYKKVKFEQIKEKFGGLRVYFSGGDDYVDGLVNMAEALSYCVCEVCGNKGKPSKGGWIRTLCPKCETCINDQTK